MKIEISTQDQSHLLAEEHLVCPVCGTTLAELEQNNALGCAMCVRIFSGHLALLLESNGQLSGKGSWDIYINFAQRDQKKEFEDSVTNNQIRKKTIRHLERLEKMYAAREWYEKAAVVRDQLVFIKNKPHF